jgi:hypothetical protein
MDDLELITGSAENLTRLERFKDLASNYAVDVSAGLMFYNPLMLAGEVLLTSMEAPEVAKSRLGACIAQMICTRPIGKLRTFSASYFNLDESNPWYQKTASDVGSTLLLQMPTYAIALYASGASLDEALTAMTIGAGVTAVSGRYFGKWMDFWRTTWGKDPAIKKGTL